MARLISLSIDLSKIDKSKIKTSDKGGQYYDVTISVNDEVNKFGQDVSMYESQSKEDREAKAAKKYLGNGKAFWSSEAKPKQETKNDSDLRF